MVFHVSAEFSKSTSMSRFHNFPAKLLYFNKQGFVWTTQPEVIMRESAYVGHSLNMFKSEFRLITDLGHALLRCVDADLGSVLTR